MDFGEFLRAPRARGWRACNCTNGLHIWYRVTLYYYLLTHLGNFEISEIFRRFGAKNWFGERKFRENHDFGGFAENADVDISNLGEC